jgi:hypothetical protein
MSEPRDEQSAPVRFDFPPEMAAEAIAATLRPSRQSVMAENAAKQAAVPKPTEPRA